MILTRPNSAIADMVESRYRKRRSFASGFTLRDAREALLFEADGNYYQWKGSLPKVVPANSTPTSTGGISDTAWKNVGNADDIAQIESELDAIEAEIEDLRESIPEGGKSAYQIAVDNGFQGTETQWLASLKGDPGAPLKLLGTLSNTNQLPTTGNNAGDAWIVGENMYAWDGTAWRKVNSQGPEGKSAYEVWLAAGNEGTELDYLASIKGDKGEPGPEGPQGVPGNNANGFDYQGAANSVSDLPSASHGNTSQAWSVGTYLYVSNGVEWINMGAIVGPKGDKGDKGDKGNTGDSAYQVWLNAGNVGTIDEYIASLKGEKGDKGDKGDQGEQGIQGLTGPTGAGLTIIDILTSTSELPQTGEEGDGYLINNELWVWLQGATEWTNVGRLAGTPITAKGHVASASALPPTANYGDAYLTEDTGHLYIYTYDEQTQTAEYVDMGSLKGDKGEKGDAGANGTDGATWIVKTTDPISSDGKQGDYAFNISTGEVFLKTSATVWTSQGTLPSITDAPSDGKTYARKDGAWEELTNSVDGQDIVPTKVTTNFIEVTAYTNNSVTGDWTPPGTHNMNVLNLTGNATIKAWPGVEDSTKPKPFSAIVYLIQDATGGHTVTLDPSYKVIGSSDINTDPNGVTILQLTYCGVGDYVDAIVAKRT